MKIGDSVYTPRFCAIRIDAVFQNSEEDARTFLIAAGVDLEELRHMTIMKN